ncbi:TPM domain-containing protein [Altererythrobacter sp.]|nr:TPM domain-containing protein [Altererythrobacter sp.]
MPILRLLLGAWLLACAAVAGAQDFPELSGRVVDAAGILSDEQEAALSAKLEQAEAANTHQFVVVTIPDLQGYEISDYGYRLGREWGIGNADRNDGVLLIVAPNERKVRIEVGYGLEPKLTDGMSRRIIQREILPAFKQSNMPRGIEAGAHAIIEQISLTVEQVQERAAAAEAERDERLKTKLIVILILVFLVPLFFFIIPLIIFMVYKKRNPDAFKQYGGGHPFKGGSSIYTRSPSAGGSYSSGSSYSSSKFSGGGGSFGGGGASGSW